MPLFNIECEECNYVWEMLVIKDILPPCPKCKSKKVKKLLSACGGIVIDGKYAVKTSTPVDKDSKMTTVLRFPEYSDRKTGKKLGYGTPEIVS